MKPTRANVLRLAKEMGLDVNLTPGRLNHDGTTRMDFDAASPPGLVFAISDCHSLVVNAEVGPGLDCENVGEFYAACIADLTAGLRPCDDPECDTCHPVSE